METLRTILTLTALLPFAICDQNFYVLTVPNQIRAQSTAQVAITYLGDGTSSNAQLTVNATISGTSQDNSNNNNLKFYTTNGRGSVNVGTTAILQLKIGNWPTGSYALTVNGDAGTLKFQRTIIINGLSKKKSSLFIQTDKGIYQAGQKVNLRVVSVNSELLPFTNQNLTVYINDANGNRIQQWDTPIPKSGIFERNFPLSTQPVEGDWSIEANIPDASANARFKVTKYVLPRYDVTLTVPSYITSKTISFPVTISAKYTYGQPVSGSYIINVTETSCSYSYSHNCRTTPVVVRGKLTGSATVSVKTGDLNLGDQLKYGTSLTAIGKVVEEFTGIEDEATKAFQTYSFEQQLSVTVNPDPFRPLMPLTATISLTKPDGTPVPNPKGEGNVTVNFGDGFAPEIRRFTFNQAGTATITVQPPEDSQNININANYNKLTGSAYVSAAGSLSSKFIAIDASAKNAVVTGRGKILLANTIPLSQAVTKVNFSIKLSRDMSPSAAIAVYYVTGCGEIVGDALRINVDGAVQTPLTLQMSTNQSQPGDNVTMTIKSLPNTYVAVLSVDQSVLLLSKGNDITKTQVYNELEQYNMGQGGYYPVFDAGFIRRPGYGGSLDQIFQFIGVQMATNGLYYKQQRCFYGFATFAAQKAVPLADNRVIGGPVPSVDSSPPRKNFPETWLWFVTNTNQSDNVEVPLTVPDTITSWVITGFALNSKTGLGLTDAPTNLTVFKPFFLVANLPFQVVRGETMRLQVLVFNYLSQDLQASVTLEQLPGQEAQFTLLDESNNANGASSTKTISVASNKVAAVTFLIKPLIVGLIPLKFKAISNVAGDTLIQTLNVKAEGVPQYFNKALLVDLRNRTTFTGTINIDVPSNAVVGSAFIQFDGLGNIMANVINNLHNLVRLPSGCGEQNMVNFVPNIVILVYMKKINRLTSGLESQLLNYLQIGYQTELTYKRYDGSFSTFGNVDASGNLWLTAFVVKSFAMAKPFIIIDNNVIANAKNYLIQSQAADGSFTNKGKEFSNIQGGSAMTPEVLTAYVLIAFLETPDSVNNDRFLANITNAVRYLENNLNRVNNAYAITIVTYALQLANSNKATEAFNKMNSLSIKDGEHTYWRFQLPKRNGTEWWYYQPPPFDVEATSYALLVYIRRGLSAADQLPLVAWLVSKQSSLGGYSSTQDTVIGIQALGAAAPNFVGPPGSTVTAVITYDTKSETFNFNTQNELVHQQLQLLPNTIRSVQVKGTGNGVAIAQVEWNYNIVINKSGNSVFDLTLTVTPLRRNTDKVNAYVLNICAAYKINGTTGMSLVEVKTLSGFTWDGLPAVNSLNGLQRVESLEGNTLAVLYYNQIPTTPNKVCTQLTAAQTVVVNNLASAQVNVYRYYSNDDRTTTMYNLPQES